MNMAVSPTLFPTVTVTVVRDRKIRTALRTNQIAGFVSVPSWKKINVYILRSKCEKPPEMLSIKRMRFIIPARNGISIVARVRWQKQTRYVYILRSKCGKTPEMLSIKRVRFIILAR